MEVGGETHAYFHRWTLGFQPFPGSDYRSHLGTWPAAYQKKKEQLKAFAEKAQKHRDKYEFFEIFMDNYEHAVKKIDRAKKMLEKSQYTEWVETAGTQGCLCHQDFTPKNLRLQQNGGITVFDFDSLTIDIPARDLRKIFNKVLKKGGNGKTRTIKQMVSAYQAGNPLTKGQWVVVAADLLFPHLFCGIVDNYFYNRAHQWSHEKYIKKLKQSIRTEDLKEELVLQMLEQIGDEH